MFPRRDLWSNQNGDSGRPGFMLVVWYIFLTHVQDFAAVCSQVVIDATSEVQCPINRMRAKAALTALIRTYSCYAIGCFIHGFSICSPGSRPARFPRSKQQRAYHGAGAKFCSARLKASGRHSHTRDDRDSRSGGRGDIWYTPIDHSHFSWGAKNSLFECVVSGTASGMPPV
jgi:hypothetical protein